MSKPKNLSHEARLKAFVVFALRRFSLRFYSRNEAMKLARIERGRYRCATCEGIFHRKEINVDHINPVVPLKDGFTTWDIYINNMFPKPEGFQILCELCHSIKTQNELSLRKYYRKQNKVDKEGKLE